MQRALTYAELKIEVRKPPYGKKTFYRVPKQKSQISGLFGIFDVTKLPLTHTIEVTVNKNGKPAIHFDKDYKTDTSVDGYYYFLEDSFELADAYATKILLEKHNQLEDELRLFESKTNVLTKASKYSDVFPHIFI